MSVCFCGCDDPNMEPRPHHIITQAELQKVWKAGLRGDAPKVPWLDLVTDPRNLVPVARRCHANHHRAYQRYELTMLPDCAFEFAAEVLGPRAYGWLNRRYAGYDPRCDALLLIPAVDRS